MLEKKIKNPFSQQMLKLQLWDNEINNATFLSQNFGQCKDYIGAAKIKGNAEDLIKLTPF